MPVTIRDLEPDDAEWIRELLSDTPEAARWSVALGSASQNGLFCRVAERSGQVFGLIVFRSMVDEAEILSLVVDAGQRRQGIGWRLIRKAIVECKAAGVRRIFLEVRESNDEARRLYARAGFKEGGRRREYYREPTEDALVLQHTVE
jgi:ribosomal-protein-alanine N-acetyltransferase